MFEQVTIKYNAGKARNHELARTKLEVSSARNDLLKAETEHAVSLGGLNILLGRELETETQLTDSLTAPKLKQSLEDLIYPKRNTR